MKIWIFERNAVAAQRIAHIATAAADMRKVEVAQSLGDLANAQPNVIGVEAHDLELVLSRPWARDARIVVWAQEESASLFEQAISHRGIVSLVAWPAFLTIPRTLELTLAFRRAITGSAEPTLRSVLAPGAFVHEWRIATKDDRDEVVQAISGIATKVSAQRLEERAVTAAHELLMNAMYDAPTDTAGRFKYADNRDADIELELHEAPTCRVGTDGTYMAIEVADNFGGLTRDHVWSGILRGFRGSEAMTTSVLDTSHGGAGLGVHRVFEASSALFAFVQPKRLTRVIALLDATLSPRELRGAPGSVHVFEDHS